MLYTALLKKRRVWTFLSEANDAVSYKYLLIASFAYSLKMFKVTWLKEILAGNCKQLVPWLYVMFVYLVEVLPGER